MNGLWKKMDVCERPEYVRERQLWKVCCQQTKFLKFFGFWNCLRLWLRGPLRSSCCGAAWLSICLDRPIYSWGGVYLVLIKTQTLFLFKRQKFACFYLLEEVTRILICVKTEACTAGHFICSGHYYTEWQLSLEFPC